MSAITNRRRNEQLVNESGVANEGFYLFLARLADLGILEGSGSPEGVIEAPVTSLYMNTAGTAGSILYIKRDADVSGDRKQGWILV